MKRLEQPGILALQPVSAQAAVPRAVTLTPSTVSGVELQKGVLIINADDWGLNRAATDRTRECVVRKAVSSVSAMVFMEDSERAAALALHEGVDAGLHLNLTTPFSSSSIPEALSRHHAKVIAYLRRQRLAQAIFHPGLQRSFEYVVQAQLDEFRRLYQGPPDRVDGHHHMHLCANVLLGRLLPAGTIARRNFSFRRGEKSFVNHIYRKAIDVMLARRHRLTDFFFSLPPFEPSQRLERMFSLAEEFVVEVETHCESTREYEFLAGGEVFSRINNVEIAPKFSLSLRSRA